MEPAQFWMYFTIAFLSAVFALDTYFRLEELFYNSKSKALKEGEYLRFDKEGKEQVAKHRFKVGDKAFYVKEGKQIVISRVFGEGYYSFLDKDGNEYGVFDDSLSIVEEGERNNVRNQ